MGDSSHFCVRFRLSNRLRWRLTKVSEISLFWRRSRSKIGPCRTGSASRPEIKSSTTLRDVTGDEPRSDYKLPTAVNRVLLSNAEELGQFVRNSVDSRIEFLLTLRIK